MKSALVFAAMIVAIGHASHAAGIFVQQATGSDLRSNQAQQVTDAVKKSVTNMPEHNLVQSENEADFVLKPSVVASGDEMRLRIEKLKDGQVISMSEQSIRSVESAGAQASATTQTAMENDSYVSDTSSNALTGDDSLEASRGIASVPSSDMSASSLDSSSMSSGDASLMDSSLSGSSTDLDSSTALSDSSQATASDSTTDTAMASPQPTNLEGASGESSADQSEMNRFNANKGRWSIGVGPSFAIGLENDDLMYNIIGGYNYEYTEKLTLRGFGDINISSGSDSGRLFNFGAGANYYPLDATIASGRPYLGADVGYASARHDDDTTAAGLALGAGAGFEFDVRQTSVDVNLHYTVLTSELKDENPQILGVRAAMNF